MSIPTIAQPQFTGQVLGDNGQFSYYWQLTFQQLFSQFAKIIPLTDARTFAKLPTGVQGALAIVTDSNTVTWGANVAGGGTHTVLAWFNGTHWTVLGI